MEINTHIENGKKVFKYGSKVKYWNNTTIYVDIDTGEIVSKREYKDDYKTIKKNERTKYRGEYGNKTREKSGSSRNGN